MDIFIFYLGGIYSFLQHTSFLEKDIRKAEWSTVITIFVLMGGTGALVFFVGRRWISIPLSQLMDGTKRMAKGQLHKRID